MTFKNAQQARVFIGALNYSGYTRGVSFVTTGDMLDVSTLNDASFRYIPGQDTSTAAIDLLLDTDTTAGGEWSNLSTWRTTQPQPLTWCPFGVVAATQVQMSSAMQTVITADADVKKAVTAGLSVQNDGPMDFGVVLEDGTASITVDTNGTALDNAAQTTNGCVWHVHVTAYSGLTSNSVVLEHSTDNSSWVTLDTATTVTGLTSERRVVASGTTVRRYLRIRDDVTGSGSTSRFVAVARR